MTLCVTCVAAVVTRSISAAAHAGTYGMKKAITAWRAHGVSREKKKMKKRHSENDGIAKKRAKRGIMCIKYGKQRKRKTISISVA